MSNLDVFFYSREPDNVRFCFLFDSQRICLEYWFYGGGIDQNMDLQIWFQKDQYLDHLF